MGDYQNAYSASCDMEIRSSETLYCQYHVKESKIKSEVKTYNYGITRIVNRKGFKCIQTRDSQDVKIEKLNENLHALENVFFAAMEQIKFYQRNSDSKGGKRHLDVHDLTKNGGKHTKH